MNTLIVIMWFAKHCTNQIRYKNGKMEYLWAFKKDAEEMWDYVNDDNLKWFTSEEMLENYKDGKESQY